MNQQMQNNSPYRVAMILSTNPSIEKNETIYSLHAAAIRTLLLPGIASEELARVRNRKQEELQDVACLESASQTHLYINHKTILHIIPTN